MDKADKTFSTSDKVVRDEDSFASSSTSKLRSRGRKRKRHDSGSSTDLEDILPENSQEVEKNLQTAATKNNLDDVVVKKILKKVVTNDHVLALVKLREEEDLKEQNPNSKFTRAKAKELMKAPFPNLELTPIKHIPVKTRPEVEELITKELPEDEDDDEYKPTNDDVPSDEDQTLESCSDLDSLPATPGTPRAAKAVASPQVLTDGPFKVPLPNISPARRKLMIEEEEATIARRTRSQHNLSATPIEHIESSFVPPDDVPAPLGDDLWNQFLEGCLNPETTKNEDDDEADPEYNVAADPDAHDEDEDKLDKSVLRISKKELNDLMNELFSVMPEDAQLAEDLAITVLDDTQSALTTSHWEGKQELISDEEIEKKANNQTAVEKQRRDSILRFSIGKSEPEDPDYNGEVAVSTDNKKSDNRQGPTLRSARASGMSSKGKKVINVCVEEQSVKVQPPAAESEPPPLLRTLREETTDCDSRRLTINIDDTVKVLPEQVLILQQQLRQHVQLAAGNFLQLFVNPAHWSHAPQYREYLEQFTKMVEANPSSVVNVCNLRPALELVNSWETSVSKDTPENKEMVEFIQNEAERSRRRFQQNSLYVGNFPETFMKVIANSPVFLYPYLLPGMPYRADNSRKFGYRQPEDELIALGLDQFWQYVEDNPEIYKKPRNHKAGRWGLVAACTLIVKHMLPWLTPRWLLYHVNRVRRDKDNPVAKFFANRKITKVEHKLLPFNPKLTLYEQPEYEMPKLWVRYLAKTSKRFRLHQYKRSGTGVPPQGVAVSVDVIEPIKKPLPPDFTKEIICTRHNLKPKVPEISHDNFDLVVVPAEQTGPMLTINPMTSSNCGPVITQNSIEMEIRRPDETDDEGNIIKTQKLIPISISKLTETKSSKPLFSTINNVIQTNDNTNMVQTRLRSYFRNTNIVNSITSPILSTSLSNNQRKSLKNSTIEELASKTGDINGHCRCCIILKKIFKVKQSFITDYYKSKNSKEKLCECTYRNFPKVTKKLRMLIDNYKSKSWCEQRRIRTMLHSFEREIKYNKESEELQSEKDGKECSLEDKEYVMAYHMKVTTQAILARNVKTKARINNVFSKFDPDTGDPVILSEELSQVFDVNLVNLYKEFMGFLNPVQAEQVDRFKDYFVHSCVGDLVKKIDCEIQDKEERAAVLRRLDTIFTDYTSSPCELCARLLCALQRCPHLARYVFLLFPHRVLRREGDRNETPPSFENPPSYRKISTKKQTKEKASVEENEEAQDDIEMTLEAEALITEQRLKEAEMVDDIDICEKIDPLETEEKKSTQNEKDLETETIITEQVLKDTEMVDNTDICEKTDPLETEEKKSTQNEKDNEKVLETETIITEQILNEAEMVDNIDICEKTDPLDSEEKKSELDETENEEILETETLITEIKHKQTESINNFMCDTLVVEFESDDSSSDEDDEKLSETTSQESSKTKQETEEIKNEGEEEEDSTQDADTEESERKTESQNIAGTIEMLSLPMSENKQESPIKSEVPEWSREEDIYTITLISQYIAPDARKNRSTLEMVHKKVCPILFKVFPYKSVEVVAQRAMRILDILITKPI